MHSLLAVPSDRTNGQGTTKLVALLINIIKNIENYYKLVNRAFQLLVKKEASGSDMKPPGGIRRCKKKKRKKSIETPPHPVLMSLLSSISSINWEQCKF